LLEPVRIVLSWSAKLMVEYPSRGKTVLTVAAALSLAFAAAAQAQTTTATIPGANAAYSHANLAAEAMVRDAAGAPAVTDGVIQAGEDASNLGKSGAGDAFDTVTGAGSGSGATALGGPLAVVTQASHGAGANSATPPTQTNSTQTNQANSNQAASDNASAESTLTGGVSNDPQ
jgi:hypothetical protein